MVQYVGREPARLVAALDDPVHDAEDRATVGRRERVGDLVEQGGIGVAEQRDGAFIGEPGLVRARDELVEHRQ